MPKLFSFNLLSNICIFSHTYFSANPDRFVEIKTGTVVCENDYIFFFCV
jgi:hypothetical protein